jgi:pyridoxamine 5'-phosphate oxidase
MDISALRKEYTRASLDETSADSDPLAQFRRWFDEAVTAQVPEPHAMALATVAQAPARPSSRIVLLKGLDARGLVFYTNYESRKGRELAANAFASLLFFWPQLERQVRIEGSVEKTEASLSDEYFRSRPLGSRLAAWASPQSEVVARREILERRFDAAAGQHGEDPSRPPYWGGYRLCPDTFEFWQGRASRLHDRLRYHRERDASWTIERLAP